MGLLITVTLLTGMASINNRIRSLEELAVFGMNRFLTSCVKRSINVRSGPASFFFGGLDYGLRELIHATDQEEG